MYVEINRHHDGDGDPKLTGASLDTAKAIQKAVWEQVATKLRDFDEHLMFASYNEPDASDMPTSIALHDLHQIFIDAVRSTGGKNTYRTLVLQAPSTSLDLANYFLPGNIPGMPNDPTPNKIMFEFHWYSPANFCILGGDASWGHEWRYWGAKFHSTDDTLHNSVAGVEEDYVQKNMQWAKKTYVDKGIPIFIGEYGVQYHASNCPNSADSLLSVISTAHFFAEVIREARLNGCSACLWAGMIDRRSLIFDKRQLDSMRSAAGY